MLNEHKISVNQVLNVVMMLGLVALVIMLTESSAFANNAGTSGLPWETPLKMVSESISGPVAFAISLIAIIAAGAGLIFGGDMQGFMKTALFVTAAIGFIIGGGKVLSTLYSTSAFIPFF